MEKKAQKVENVENYVQSGDKDKTSEKINPYLFQNGFETDQCQRD